MLSPWFGSSIIVWAFIISTFLGAFSLGSILGGVVVRLSAPRRRRSLLVLGGTAAVWFAFNAMFARGFLGWLDGFELPVPAALTFASTLLFVPPVCGLSALTPVFIERLHLQGYQAGFASGLVYCVGTLGNIAGIMLTAFVLIPALPISSLLWIWSVCVAAATPFVLRCGS